MQEDQKQHDQVDGQESPATAQVDTNSLSAASDQPETPEVESGAEESSSTAEDSQDNLDGLIDPRYKWYIVNTYAGSEDSARLNLLDRISRAGFEEFLGR